MIYLRIQELDQVHLVTAYGKDQKDDVSADDKKTIRRFVQILTPIRHARSVPAGRPVLRAAKVRRLSRRRWKAFRGLALRTYLQERSGRTRMGSPAVSR